jgi:hypothetical protein
LVEWKDGLATWVPLKDLKNSNPVEVAEYAAVNQCDIPSVRGTESLKRSSLVTGNVLTSMVSNSLTPQSRKP